MTSSRFRLPTAALRRPCEPFSSDFRRSDQLPAQDGELGQQRAIDAIRLGLRLENDGNNIYVMGRHGSHRHDLAEQLAREYAAGQPTPDDWCYVNNFKTPERPRTLRFPAGRGAAFKQDMAEFIEELRLAIPAAFEGDDYRSQLKAVEAQTQKELEQEWKTLETKAEARGIGVLQTPTGYVLAPIRDGQVLGDEEFSKLPEKEREKVQKAIQELSDELQARIERMPRLRKKHRERVKGLNREVTEAAVGALLQDLKTRYGDIELAGAYLDDVETNIIENSQDFHEQESPPLPFLARDPSESFGQYEVNLIVGNESDGVAPVIFEANPSYFNLIGKVEHRSEMGNLVTDFRLIRGGALLQANGGVLILDMHRVVTRPFVWEALKQALFAGEVRIESPGETYGFVSTTTLKPEPILLKTKIILVGERWLYYLLSAYDAEFSDLFKIAADFDDELPRNADNVDAFARLVADRIRARDLRSFDRDAVARVIEQRARHAEDSERLSTHMRSLEDLLIQADYWARDRNSDTVGAQDVARAIEETARRQNRSQLRIIDAVKRNSLLIDTEGAVVGQVNGLAVISLGEHRFGHPMRITATTRLGSGKFVDIEREVELGGAIHSKGVMILSSALASRYARDVPLAVQANIVFEQSYGGVEGDSASVAELSVLISSLSGVPIRQNIAVTGSVNQLGRVQVVGGTNEKIEGFFDVCKERGLDGSHGVVIPSDNVKHLMLREDVVAAVDAGQFNIYAVSHIDEAVAILTGEEAGERGEEGTFPEGTVNRKVEDQLIKYAMRRREFDADSVDRKKSGKVAGKRKKDDGKG